MPNYDKLVVRPPYNAGQRREAIVPSGVAQYGEMVGNHFTGGSGEGGRKDSDYAGINARPGKAGYPSEMGNARAVSCQQGPGGGRNILRNGQNNGAGLSDRPNSPPSGVSNTPLVNLDWKAGGKR